MPLDPALAAQAGTTGTPFRYAARGLAPFWCAWLLACTPERVLDDAPDATESAPVHDAGFDAASSDDPLLADARFDAASSDDPLLPDELASFVAEHRACSSDDDCVIVGDCSHTCFPSVARSAEAEAMNVVLRRCQQQDGPIYHARCRAGMCDRTQSTGSCGSAIETECPAVDMVRQVAGCGTVAAGFRDGCQTKCKGQADDGPCTTGYSCQQTSINPCWMVTGGASCSACGEDTWLCLPVPACQVELALTYDGGPLARVVSPQATELTLWLMNRTDQTLTFSFELPCHGPSVVGLGDYDLWQSCLAGACPTEHARTEVTLKPHERLRWRSALVEVDPSECNAHGLASGKYMPSFSLPYVQGANVCGPTATSLRVGSAAYSDLQQR
jgi:hypothetical protein